MKKKTPVFWMLILAIILVLQTNSYAQSYQTAEEAVKDANEFLQEKMNLESYYKLNSEGKNLNKELAKNGTEAFWNKPVFVYGDQIAASAAATTNNRVFDTVNGVKVYRAMGYALDGSIFPNPSFTPDNEGYLATDKKWVKTPWGPAGKRQLYGENGKVYPRNVTGGAYDYINKWIENGWFSPDNVKTATGKSNFFTANPLEAPSVIKNNLEDFVYIIQPPTEHAWGLGIAFYYWDNFNRLNYRSFLLKPFNMAVNDISAEFADITVEEYAYVKVKVKSTFDKDLKEVPFKWEITTSDGTVLTETYEVFYEGASEEPDALCFPKTKKEALLRASFKMPDSQVKVKFSVNEDGNNPEEAVLENNTIECALVPGLATPLTTGDFELDYNILSRRINYPLSDNEISAELTLPRGSWNGNATGKLNVYNQATDLLRLFVDSQNDDVNEPSTTIIRNPIIHTTVHRKDFNDNPPIGLFRNLNNPFIPVTRSGDVTFSGSVSRPYRYTTYCSSDTCSGHTRYATTTASFNSGTNTTNISTKIYNGKPNITPKIFDNKIVNNNASSLKKDLFWTSEPYDINVIRWMYHIDEDNKLYGDTDVDGQYQRIFTQQCSADLKWAAASTMKTKYQRSREAARNRDYRKSEYDRAVFASEKELQKYDYPIKSGYYFNPTGEYSFELETVTYKTSTADTDDHNDLVNALIKAFRYESDLMYINKNKTPVNLQNEPLQKSGNNYKRKPAALTSEDPTGVDGVVLLNVLDRNDDKTRYTKKVEEIYHTQGPGQSGTHVFWKEILEGYSESGTLSSENNFKYREYVKDGQRMYKITEKTRVTIQINPSDKKVYTFANMPNNPKNDPYYVKAWIDDIELSKIDSEYKKLKTLTGVSVLDQIKVEVRGSMYDDLNS